MISLVRDISGIDDSIRGVLRVDDGSVRVAFGVGEYPIVGGPVVLLSDSPSSRVLLPGAPEPTEFRLLDNTICRIEALDVTATAMVAACRPDHPGGSEPWQLRAQKVDPVGEVGHRRPAA